MKSIFYPAVFVPNDGKYSVFFPDLPGCLPWGDTAQEAFSDAVEGLAAFLEVSADEGDFIPPPSSIDAALKRYATECEKDGEPVPDGTFVQLVPVPAISEQQARVKVSFKRYTLDMIDRKAEAAGMTRSGFLAAAARAYEVETHTRQECAD